MYRPDRPGAQIGQGADRNGRSRRTMKAASLEGKPQRPRGVELINNAAQVTLRQGDLGHERMSAGDSIHRS
jgi:hypothetical protein